MLTPARVLGRVLTGFGALALLCALLIGAPMALLAFAGNPLPAQVPTLDEVGAMLTTRDDGQLFLRALALVGWAGWATFALSVLVELGALACRRPAPRLPGMNRQQRAAAALVGSAALILAASPVAASAAAVAGPPAPAATSVSVALPPSPVERPVLVALPEPVRQQAVSAAPSTARTAEPEREPVYRVARGDRLGSIAARYLDGFDDYPTLARLNRLADPDRIHPGQLLRLPTSAQDRGAGPHATGRLVARPTPPRPSAPAAAPAGPSTRPSASDTAVSDASVSDTSTTGASASNRTGPDPVQDVPIVAVGAAGPGDPSRVNRPLAVSAVLAASGIVGAQIGAVLGLRRRPATARAGTDRKAAPTGRRQWELPAGRHRRE